MGRTGGCGRTSRWTVPSRFSATAVIDFGPLLRPLFLRSKYPLFDAAVRRRTVRYVWLKPTKGGLSAPS
jgi:hypothetical protein